MKKIIITTIVALMCASNVCAESIDNNTFITDTVCSSSDNTRASDYINTYALSISSNSTGTVTVTSNMTCKPTVSKCKITSKIKKIQRLHIRFILNKDNHNKRNKWYL